MLYLAEVAVICTADACSDALGRPSTFTTQRVAVLFVSMFAIGLPIPFAAAHGYGWRLISPICFGLGLDGLGRALLVPRLQSLACTPITLSTRFLQWLERTALTSCLRVGARLCMHCLRFYKALTVFAISGYAAYIVIAWNESWSECSALHPESLIVWLRCVCAPAYATPTYYQQSMRAPLCGYICIMHSTDIPQTCHSGCTPWWGVGARG